MFSLIMDDEIELNVLHMLIIEAKFSKKIERKELRASPYVCRLAKKVLDEMNKGELSFSTNIENYPDLSERIKIMVKEIEPETWNNWDRDEKIDYLKLLICPFEASDVFFEKHVDIVLSNNIKDYPDLLKSIIKNIQYEIEINDPEYWKSLSLIEIKKEIKYMVNPYKVTDTLLNKLIHDIMESKGVG